MWGGGDREGVVEEVTGRVLVEEVIGRVWWMGVAREGASGWGVVREVSGWGQAWYKMEGVRYGGGLWRRVEVHMSWEPQVS